MRRDKRLPKETVEVLQLTPTSVVQSTSLRPGLHSEGAGQPGGTANSNLLKFDKEI